MNEIREVHTYEDSSTTGWVVVLAVLIIGLIAFTLALWQPWVASTPSNTTIIRDSQPPQQVTPAPSTTIINPPPTVVNPPKTDIRINQDKGTSGTTGGTQGQETTGGETTGG